jgi:hypothetical protein
MIHVGVGIRGRSGLGCGLLAKATDKFLCLSNRQPAGDHHSDQLPLSGRRRSRKRSSVAFGDVAAGERLLDGRLEVEQSKRVGYGGPGPADPSGYVVLRQAELIGQLPVGASLLHGVEVGTLDILDDRDGQLVALGHLANDCRDAFQTGHLSGSDASLTGHELVAIQNLGDQNGLENAMDGNAGREGLKGFLLDTLARLVWIAPNSGDRDLHRCRSGRTGLGNQGSETAPQAGVPLDLGWCQRGLPSGVSSRSSSAEGSSSATV